MCTIKNFRNYLPVLGLVITYVLMGIWINSDYLIIKFDTAYIYILFINPVVFGFLSILLNAVKYKSNKKYEESTFAILIQLGLLILSGNMVVLITVYLFYIILVEFLILLVFFLIEKTKKHKKSKMFKIVAAILSILLIVQLSGYLITKYGWRLWGFEKCENPDALWIDTVYITDETVNVVGETSSSALRYNGYTYKIVDENLYVGVKYDLNGEGWAGFSFEIKGDFNNLKNVILTNESNEKCIWNIEKDKKYMEKINRVRLYKSVFVDHNYEYYKEKMKNAEFIYANEELLNKIQHPTFSDELRLSKGGYLGVAELRDGEEMYLDFEIDGNWYNIIGSPVHYDY